MNTIEIYKNGDLWYSTDSIKDYIKFLCGYMSTVEDCADITPINEYDDNTDYLYHGYLIEWFYPDNMTDKILIAINI